MQLEQIILAGLIIVNTIASIIGALTGNKDLVTKAEQKKQKALNKLLKKQKKQEMKYEETQIKINSLNKENKR